MKLKSFLFSLFVAVLMAGVSGVAVATDADGQYSNLGRGSDSCATYLNERAKDGWADIANGAWLNGYFTAIGYLQSTEKMFHEVADVVTREYLIVDYCKKNPLDDLEDAAANAANQLLKRVGFVVACPLCKPAAGGDFTKVKQLLADGANPNVADDYGWTALMFATAEGYTELVKVLLSAEANPNMTRNTGNTALMIAALYGHAEVVKLLLSAGAYLTAKDRDGWTALRYAKAKGHSEIVRILEEAGARE